MDIAGNELLLASEQLDGGTWRTRVNIPSIHCAGCIREIEDAIKKLECVSKSRVNLSRKCVVVEWLGTEPPLLIETIEAAGHQAHLDQTDSTAKTNDNSKLLKATAVAGFTSANIMMMSVAVWSGANPQMTQFFHWVSALIAFPTLLYSGRIFFNSAWLAIKSKKTNMDVPISVGVCLAFAMSLYDTVIGHHAVYFDASVTLLFFLLIGRTLDQWVRSKASETAAALAKLLPKGVNVIGENGLVYCLLEDIEPGQTIEVPTGERIPLDGLIESGVSSVDTSIVNGESLPMRVQIGKSVMSGMLNLEQDLRVKVTANFQTSFLSQTVRLMDEASSSRGVYRPLADRVVQYYSPVIHLTALLTFVGWMFYSGAAHQSISAAIAVLIITCPCALALAVPMVQVVAMRRLFNAGVLVRDGSALERLNEIDTIVFDKTGTLTFGKPSLSNLNEISPNTFQIGRAIAAHSTHPYSRAIFNQSADTSPMVEISLENVEEYIGRGLEAKFEGATYRLGSPIWAHSQTNDVQECNDTSSVLLTKNGKSIVYFKFDDLPLPDAASQVKRLLNMGLDIQLLSGDRHQPVAQIAELLGVSKFMAQCNPQDKSNIIKELSRDDRHVLMVGDGLNDAPALAQAYVSMAPSNAADIGRSAADFVFLNAEKLPIFQTIQIAKKTNKLVRQNFTMALLYNLIALPVAILGFATPLIAAIAMSTSSILVVLNSCRLLWTDISSNDQGVGK